MGEHEEALPLVLRCQLEERADDAPTHLFVGLTVLPTLLVAEPAAELLRRALLELSAGQPLPGADVDLAQRVDGDRTEPVRPGHALGGLEGAAQRARVDRREALARERP